MRGEGGAHQPQFSCPNWKNSDERGEWLGSAILIAETRPASTSIIIPPSSHPYTKRTYRGVFATFVGIK